MSKLAEAIIITIVIALPLSALVVAFMLYAITQTIRLF